jgi:ATP-dependent protease HslVU (ClpYQ) peptidase subunit
MIRSTTVICVRHQGKTAMAADGQVTMGQTILKQTAQKIRRLGKGSVLAGFAGATSDAFALFTRFEAKLEEYRGNLSRAAIELAKDWRMEKALRQLDALLIVADAGTASWPSARAGLTPSRRPGPSSGTPAWTPRPSPRRPCGSAPTSASTPTP